MLNKKVSLTIRTINMSKKFGRNFSTDEFQHKFRLLFPFFYAEAAAYEKFFNLIRLRQCTNSAHSTYSPFHFRLPLPPTLNEVSSSSTACIILCNVWNTNCSAFKLTDNKFSLALNRCHRAMRAREREISLLTSIILFSLFKSLKLISKVL